MPGTRRILAMLTFAVASACGGGGDNAPPTAPPPPPPAPTVALSGSAFEVRGVGDSLLVSASATPSGATVTWSIASPTVASVSPRGASALLTAASAGTTTLTVEALSGSQRASATATVTVVPIVRSVKLDSTGAQLLVGGSRQLRAVVQRDAGSLDSVRWTSRSTQLATVSVSGLVTGVGAGTAVIVAESVADATRRDSVTLQVAAPVVGAVTITPTTDTLLVGAFRNFAASVTADSGLSTAVTWTSSASSIASVNATGRATAVAPGSAIISARSVADPLRVASATLVVRAPEVRQLRVVGTTPLTAGAQAQYTTEVVADPGVSTAVTWSSSQPGVASVDNTGRVTAIGGGITRIIARSVATPVLADSVTLTVNGPPRFAAWETQQLGVIGGQVEAAAASSLVSLDAASLLVTYHGGSFSGRTFYWRDSLHTIAPAPSVPTAVVDLSIASDGHVAGWHRPSPRVGYRMDGTTFIALPPLPDGAVLMQAPTALPNRRVGAHGRVGGFDRAYIWTGTQWQERFRIAPLIQESDFVTMVFFTENDILYYEPRTTTNWQDHRLLRWSTGNTFDELSPIPVEAGFFIPEFVGRSSFDFFVKSGRPLRRYNAGVWSELTLGMDANESVLHVTWCPTRAVVGTNKNRVIAVDGAVGVELGTNADFKTLGLWEIACAPDGTVRRTGSNGYVGRWTGSLWVTELLAPAITAVRAVSPTLAYAGTAAGAIHRFNGSVWSEVFRPAPGEDIGAVQSIAAWPDGRAVATARRREGSNTEVRLTTSGGAWTVAPLSPTGVVRLWGLSADEVWGITMPGGHIVRSRNGGAFEVMRSDQGFAAIGGRAGGHMIAIAVTLETFRWTGTTWESIAAPLSNLKSIATPTIWSDTDAWIAVSTRQNDYPNIVYRFNGASWLPVDMGPVGGSASLMITHALLTPGPGEVYALHGVVESLQTPLSHRIDGAWFNIRPLLTRWPGGFGIVADGAPGLALVTDNATRLLMSRPGLTSATRGPIAPVRRRR